MTGRSLRIAVCLPQVPFARGGAEILAENLVGALCARGHRAGVVSVPFRWHPTESLLENAALWRLLDFTQIGDTPIDLVIGTKFPSYLISHPRKVVWLFHQFRQAYDLHGTRFAQFGDDTAGAAARQAIRRVDGHALGEAKGVFTISRNTAERLRRFNGIEAEVLWPPAPRADLRWLGDDGFILSVGRLDPAKRTDLLVEAVARTPGSRAVVAGDGADRLRLEQLAVSLGVAERVRFLGRVSDEDLRNLYGRCRAVFYAPHDEDFGMVTVEAHLAAKPVLTTTDAGGVLEFVDHEVTGLVAAPTVAAIAAELARIVADGDFSRRLGLAGLPAARALNWDTVVDRILETGLA